MIRCARTLPAAALLRDCALALLPVLQALSATLLVRQCSLLLLQALAAGVEQLLVESPQLSVGDARSAALLREKQDVNLVSTGHPCVTHTCSFPSFACWCSAREAALPRARRDCVTITR